MSKAAATWDRISNLPDSLLHHIHSFLESKDGARTSVLSKRWRYIWTTVPTLDFKMENFGFDPNPLETQKFMDFVDGTLHRGNSLSIDKFVLVCDEPLNGSQVHSWISHVIRGNVKELNLKLYRNHPPLSLFTCESLISLDLYCPNFTLPKYISFPKLKRLKLKGFEFSDECWNEERFSNSPVLEELTLLHCKFNMRNFCILIPTLKLLNITTGWPWEHDVQDCVLKIHAPELVTFSYWGYVAKEFALSRFEALVEANVYFYYQVLVEAAEAKSQLLSALAHVKRLTVCDRTLQAICFTNDVSNNLLTFRNVKRLSICDVISSDQGLVALLKALPNLESLVFVNYMNDEAVEYSDNESILGANNHEDKGDVAAAAERENKYDSEYQNWALDIVTAGCSFPHLKSVCFKQFGGNPREVKWVRLILKDAKALEIMSIRYWGYYYNAFGNAKTEKELMVDIPSFPRASPDCVIKFCSGV